MDETTPLFQSEPKRNKWICKLQCTCPCSVKYRLPIITESGAIVVIIWNTLMCIALFCLVFNHPFYLLSDLTMLTFPIAGYVADTWVGRFRVLQVSVIISLTSAFLGTILQAAGLLTTSPVISALMEVNFGLGSLGAAMFASCFIPFTWDQLTGASGEQLSFTMYWLLWGVGTGLIVSIVVNNEYISSLPFVPLVIQILTLLLLLAAAFLMWCQKHSLMTVPQLTNPIKHVFVVLKYAWKHKYPENRSALTYWEEDYPSRIDLGKSKYGGPFTFEEVEDVKTVFRLVSVIMCTGMFTLGSWTAGTVHFNSEFWNLVFTNYTLGLLLLSFGLPVYHFIIYPIFYNYIPSMLKRIGTGFFLVVLSYLFSVCVLGGLSHHEPYQCDIVTLPKINSSVDYWLLVPSITYNFGFVIALTSLIEFVAAQTPVSVAGMMTGLIIFCILCSGFTGWLIYILLSNFLPDHLLGMSCFFYKDSLYALLSIVFFILYIRLASKYKLRERSDIVPIYLIAEDYYEKEFVREREYLQEVYSNRFTIDSVD